MERKVDKVKRLVAAGEYKAALQICKEWRYSDPSYTDTLRLGYECLMYPDFYRQIGKDPRVEYERAIAVLLKVFGDRPLKDS